MRYFIVDKTDSQDYLHSAPAHISTVSDVNDADAILVFGGDGAMLYAIHALRLLNKPFIGVNAGTRGFLMNNIEVPSGIWNRLNEVSFQSLWLLEGKVITNQGDKIIWGFNDIWVERASGQTLRMEISIDGIKQPGMLVGDGILCCTPQGSTGYNLALRGKAILPGVPVIQVTPMSSLIDKSPLGSIILSDESIIVVDFLQTNKRQGAVYFDGHKVDVNTVQSIEIKKSSLFVGLGFIEDYAIKMKVLSWQFHKPQ